MSQLCAASTPSKVHTPTPWNPSLGGEGSQGGVKSSEGEDSSSEPVLRTMLNQVVDTSKCLDAFQNQYISEDDASFETLVSKLNHEKRIKYKWLYNKDSKKLLLLTDGSNDPAEDTESTTTTTEAQNDNKKKKLAEASQEAHHTWGYTAKNSEQPLIFLSFYSSSDPTLSLSLLLQISSTDV